MKKAAEHQIKSQCSKGPVPVIIGVTGHRDIPTEDKKNIAQSIRSIFNKIKSDCPDSCIQLLTMLASGADTIAAETAIEEGLEVIGLLPFPVDMYRMDFEGEDLECFDSLYSRCTKIYTMPFLPGSSRKSVETIAAERDKQYAYGGAFVSRYSNALIAVWDGLDPHLKGGTADIVRVQLNASPNEYMMQPDFLSGRQNGPVYWIYTRRVSHTESVAKPPETLPFECLRSIPLAKSSSPREIFVPYEILYPYGWVIDTGNQTVSCKNAAAHYDGIIKSINSFNKDASCRLSKKVQKESWKIYDYADQLALIYQKKIRRSIKYLLILGTLTFTLMTVFSEIFTHAFVLFIFFMSLAYTALYLRGLHSKNIDGKYYDYRSLAELVRVMTHVNSIGAYADPIDLTTGKQQSLLPWICIAARTCLMDMFFEQKKTSSAECNMLLKEWVSAQQQYHEATAAKRNNALKVRKVFRFSFFIGAILAAAGFFVVRLLDVNPLHSGFFAWFDFSNLKSSDDPAGFASVCLQVSFDLCLSIGAALALYMHLCAFEDEIILFERSATVFKRAALLMNDAISSADIEQFTRIAIDLAREAVSENFEWNTVHRSIPLEMPMG